MTELRLAGVVFGAAFLVRLVHIWLIKDSPFVAIVMGDSRAYDTWARRLAAGDWIGQDVFYQAPLYPYFLGVVYALFGTDPIVVRVCQAVLGSAACVFLALAGQRLFSQRVGLGAGLALAFYPAAIFFDGLLQKAVLDGFFICVILWLVSRLIVPVPPVPPIQPVPPVQAAGWLSLGLALGGLSLTRENALVFVVVLGAWAVFRDRRAPLLSPARLMPAGAFVLGLALVLLPVAVRNAYVSGGFFITTSQFGPNFYLGNNPYTDGTAGSLRGGRGSAEYERQDAIELAERAAGRPLSAGEVSSYWTDRAVTYITSQPGDWLRLMTRKFVLLWNAVEMLDTESQESYSEWSWPLRATGWIGHFGVIVPLAVIGVWVTWPDRRRLAILHVMCAAYAASVLVFFIYARYRYPLVPFLILFAAAGVAGLSTFLQTQPRRQVLALSGLFLAAVALTNWPMLSHTSMRAISEHNLGAALQTDGRVDEAIARYRRATEIMPSYAPAYNNLGTALAAKGQATEAVAAYERALSLEPNYPNAHYNLANALLQAGRSREAIEHFRQALASSPGGADVHNNLGIALTNEGRLQEAIAEFQQALTFEADAARVHRNLGETLARAGRRDEALTHLIRAAQLDATDPVTHYMLATLLADANRLPEAIDAFQAALARQPDFVEAHNDLGIALASTGRFDQAITHLERALALALAGRAASPDLEAAVRQNLAMVRAAGRR